MFVFLSIIAVVLSLVLVVGVHEAGHAIVARFFHIKIKRISIGFGRPFLMWRTRSQIELVWAVWPIGGYVQLLNTRNAPVPVEEYPFCFDKKPKSVRFLVLIAGVVANMVMAWLMLVLLFLVGYQQRVPVIASIVVPSIAASAGLQSDDKILSIRAHPVASWEDAGAELLMAWGERGVPIVVSSKLGKPRALTLDLTHWQAGPVRSLLLVLGIKPYSGSQYIVHVAGETLPSACLHALSRFGALTILFFGVLKQLLTGVLPFSLLLGPVGVFTLMVGSFLQGLAVFLYFIASFSLSVAFFNLFPFPGLDGGSLWYLLMEKIRGKPVSVAFEVLLSRLIMIAFCLVLVQLLLNDLQRYG